ncbi:MAG: type VI secretion system baseplate subunit TssG [Pseudomonadota bacterium]
MADPDRNRARDLSGRMPEDATRYELLALLRALEAGEARFGRAALPRDEPARLGQRVRQTFATRDVAEVVPGRESQPPVIRQQALCLLGPDGPLPYHVTRWVLDRLSNRWFSPDGAGAATDSAFLDFCDMVQHRHVALFYRAWAESRLEVQHERGEAGGVAAVFAALVGAGLPGQAGADRVPQSLRLRATGTLAHRVRGPERATGFVASVVQAPVRLREFVGNTTELPKRLQSSLSARSDSAVLGRTAVIGARVYRRHNRVEFCIGPLPMSRYAALLPGGADAHRLADAIKLVMGEGIISDVRLVLEGRAVPPATLARGAGAGVQLGRTSWLPVASTSAGPRADAEDLVRRGVVGKPLQEAA